VIAQQRVHLPAGFRGFAFELAQQIEHLPRLGAPIEHVAGLDQDGAPARPAAPRVDQPRLAQDRRELVERAVDVANGDDALRGLDRADVRAGPGLRERRGRLAQDERSGQRERQKQMGSEHNVIVQGRLVRSGRFRAMLVLPPSLANERSK
jgi:hypothetical protein